MRTEFAICPFCGDQLISLAADDDRQKIAHMGGARSLDSDEWLPPACRALRRSIKAEEVQNLIAVVRAAVAKREAILALLEIQHKERVMRYAMAEASRKPWTRRQRRSDV